MITYQSHLWKSASWQRDTRYYTCELRQNLFGEWIVIRSWGDIRSKRGRQMENQCDSFSGAEKAFEEVTKRRKYRRYQLVSQY